jgi:hypothetical protein
MDMSLRGTQIQSECCGIESQCPSHLVRTLVSLLTALDEHFYLCVCPELLSS